MDCHNNYYYNLTYNNNNAINRCSIGFLSRNFYLVVIIYL